MLLRKRNSAPGSCRRQQRNSGCVKRLTFRKASPHSRIYHPFLVVVREVLPESAAPLPGLHFIGFDSAVTTARGGPGGCPSHAKSAPRSLFLLAMSMATEQAPKGLVSCYCPTLSCCPRVTRNPSPALVAAGGVSPTPAVFPVSGQLAQRAGRLRCGRCCAHLLLGTFPLPSRGVPHKPTALSNPGGVPGVGGPGCSCCAVPTGGHEAGTG